MRGRTAPPWDGRRYRATPAVGHPVGRPRWMTGQRTRQRRQASTARDGPAALGVVDGVTLIGSALDGDLGSSRACPRSDLVGYRTSPGVILVDIADSPWRVGGDTAVSGLVTGIRMADTEAPAQTKTPGAAIATAADLTTA
jgi:hypothetical protein